MIDNKAIQGVAEETEKFVSQPKCPFSKVTWYVNKANALITTEKMPKLKNFFSSLLKAVLQGKPEQTYDTRDLIDDTLSIKSSLKVKNYLYDVMYIQLEVYDLIKAILADPAHFSDLRQLAWRGGIKNKDGREFRGLRFFQKFQNFITPTLAHREGAKFSDPSFEAAIDEVAQHSLLTKGGELTIAQLLAQWACDGFTSFRGLVCNLPEVYHAKYGRYPSTEEYRALIQQNIKKVIVPLASLNLNTLVRVVRKEPKIEKTEDMKAFMNNPLGIKSDTFELDDEGNVVAKQRYIQEVADRMMQEMGENRKAQMGAQMFVWPWVKHTATYPLRTWCPALAAKTKDDKRIVEQFCADIMSLLDKIYFPFRDTEKA